MNWFYIIIRTFPFWAIPSGLVLMGVAFRGGKKMWILVGLVLVAASVYFLSMQGHFTAVPFVHELLTSPP